MTTNIKFERMTLSGYNTIIVTRDGDPVGAMEADMVKLIRSLFKVEKAKITECSLTIRWDRDADELQIYASDEFKAVMTRGEFERLAN